ncbi:hypothetical protein D3C84_1054960 [compost metagenome]
MKGAAVGAFTIPRVAFLEPIVPQLSLCLEIEKRLDSYRFRIHHEAINYCRGVIALEGDGV